MRHEPKKSVTGWQPMETAPKDGTDILIYGGFSMPTVSIGYWGGKRPACWKDKALGSYPRPPVAWMPIPDPPKRRPPWRE